MTLVLLALAQTVQVGTPITGALERSDVQEDGRYADRYALAAAVGSRLRIRLESTAFDPFLRLEGPHGFEIENDDESDQSRASRILVEISREGEYRVVATSLEAGKTGAYRLTVEAPPDAEWNRPLPPLPAGARPRAIRPGNAVEGRLDDRDPTVPAREGESYCKIYELEATAGQRLEVRMESEEFDTLVRMEGAAGFRAVNDDDPGGGTTDSLLDVTLPATGSYRVYATSFQGGATGRYRFLVVEVGAAGAGGRAIVVGDTVEGQLTTRDPRRRSGQYFHRYTFAGQRGRRIVCSVESSAFPSYLILEMPNGNQEASSTRILDVELPVDGEYTLILSSGRRGIVGRYRFNLVEPGPRRPRADAASTAAPFPDGRVAAELTTDDPRLESGEYFDRYEFAGTRGQSFAAWMTSEEVDPFLIVVAPSGEQRLNDDVAPGDRNARVAWELPEDGLYAVLATAYRVGEHGAYALGAGSLPEPASETPAGTGRVWGVFAGINDYPEGIGDLTQCAEDATRLAEALRSTGRLAPESVVLTDRRATVRAVSEAIRSVGAQAQRGDLFVFFYSGHGNRLERGDPREADGKDETIYLYDGELRDDEVDRLFRYVRARLAIIALDSCYAGGFARDVASRPGRLGFFSCEEDILSLVAGKFAAGGYLSHFLRLALGGAADAGAKDGTLTVGEVTQYLHEEWARNVDAMESSSGTGARSNQSLVVERGLTKSDDPLLRVGE